MSSGDPFDDYDPETARARARVVRVGPGCLLLAVAAEGVAAIALAALVALAAAHHLR